MISYFKKIQIIHILIFHTLVTFLSLPLLFGLEWIFVTTGTAIKSTDMRGVLGVLLAYGGMFITYAFIISFLVPWILYIFKLKKFALYSALSPWLLVIVLILISTLISFLNLFLH